MSLCVSLCLMCLQMFQVSRDHTDLSLDRMIFYCCDSFVLCRARAYSVVVDTHLFLVRINKCKCCFVKSVREKLYMRRKMSTDNRVKLLQHHECKRELSWTCSVWFNARIGFLGCYQNLVLDYLTVFLYFCKKIPCKLSEVFGASTKTFLIFLVFWPI